MTYNQIFKQRFLNRQTAIKLALASQAEILGVRGRQFGVPVIVKP
jgi:hypothetical protein